MKVFAFYRVWPIAAQQVVHSFVQETAVNLLHPTMPSDQKTALHPGIYVLPKSGSRYDVDIH